MASFSTPKTGAKGGGGGAMPDAARAALDHLWMHNRSWAATAESGGPRVIVEGRGVRVTDSDGREWMDVNGGYMCVNVGSVVAPCGKYTRRSI